MQSSRFLFSLITLLYLSKLTASAQDSIRTNVPPGQITNKVTLLIPKGNLLIREQYRDWHSNYWFFWTDTVTETENGMLTGRLGTVDPKTFTVVDGCDPVIRKIRNETLMRHMADRYGDAAMGLSLTTDRDSLNPVPEPTYEDEVGLCPDAFEAKAQAWYDSKMADLQQEQKGRLIRRELVRVAIEKGKAEYLDSAFFAGFLKDFSWSPIDGNTFLLLAEHRTDALLEACGRLSDKHFRSVTLAVQRSTREQDAAAAVERLKAAKVKGGRKRKLIRTMRRG